MTDPASPDRPDVEWVRSWAPGVVTAGASAVALAGIGLFVSSHNLPVVLAAGLVALLLVLVVRERVPFTDPRACADAAVIVAFGSHGLALACGIVVSVQRAVWVDGTPVAWWVHVLVALGIVAVTGSVACLAVLLCFLVDLNAALLGGNWGVLAGVVVAPARIWISGDSVWPALLWGASTALVVGPLLTAVLRVRLVWRPALP